VYKSVEGEMRFNNVILAWLLVGVAAYAASDPFVGTWIYSREKSPKPTIKYKIGDLGGDRYALTGSGGDTTEIEANGVFSKGPRGEKVSFKKLDDHDWQMIRFDPDKMVRVYKVSADDKTLTINDVFAPNGKEHKQLTTYARLSDGKSIYGEWQSVSSKEESADEPGELFIKPFGRGGLTFAWSTYKNHLDIHFDGKAYFEAGPTAKKGDATSGRRVNAHLLMLEGQTSGHPDDKEEWSVSEDGKTLTIVSKPVKSSAVFTSIFDKR
jgi:hypothetical protein